MNKTELINKLITNSASGWTEADRAALEVLSVERLQQFVANSEQQEPDLSGFTLDQWLDAAPEHLKPSITELKTKATAPVQNNAPLQLTNEQWMAACPASLKDQLQAGQQLHANERARLVGVITANAANVFTAEQLNAKPFGELQALAALAAPQAPVENASPFWQPVNNYGPAGAQPLAAMNAGGDAYDAGGLSVQNWDK